MSSVSWFYDKNCEDFCKQISVILYRLQSTTAESRRGTAGKSDCIFSRPWQCCCSNNNLLGKARPCPDTTKATFNWSCWTWTQVEPVWTGVTSGHSLLGFTYITRPWPKLRSQSNRDAGFHDSECFPQIFSWHFLNILMQIKMAAAPPLPLCTKTKPKKKQMETGLSMMFHSFL